MSLDVFLRLPGEPDRLPIAAALKRDLGNAYRSGDIADSFGALADAIDALDARTSLALIKAQCEHPISAEHFPLAHEIQADLGEMFAIDLEAIGVAEALSPLLNVVASLESRISDVDSRVSQTRRDLGFVIHQLRQAGLDIDELEE